MMCCNQHQPRHRFVWEHLLPSVPRFAQMVAARSSSLSSFSIRSNPGGVCVLIPAVDGQGGCAEVGRAFLDGGLLPLVNSHTWSVEARVEVHCSLDLRQSLNKRSSPNSLNDIAYGKARPCQLVSGRTVYRRRTSSYLAVPRSYFGEPHLFPISSQ